MCTPCASVDSETTLVTQRARATHSAPSPELVRKTIHETEVLMFDDEHSADELWIVIPVQHRTAHTAFAQRLHNIHALWSTVHDAKHAISGIATCDVRNRCTTPSTHHSHIVCTVFPEKPELCGNTATDACNLKHPCKKSYTIDAKKLCNIRCTADNVTAHALRTSTG